MTIVLAVIVSLLGYEAIVVYAKHMKINWDWGDREQETAHA